MRREETILEFPLGGLSLKVLGSQSIADEGAMVGELLSETWPISISLTGNSETGIDAAGELLASIGDVMVESGSISLGPWADGPDMVALSAIVGQSVSMRTRRKG